MPDKERRPEEGAGARYGDDPIGRDRPGRDACGANAVVPQPTRQAISELERRDIPLLAATARRSWSVAHYLRQAELDLPAVLLNGALGRDKGGEPTFHQCTFDPADAAAALGRLRRDTE